MALSKSLFVKIGREYFEALEIPITYPCATENTFQLRPIYQVILYTPRISRNIFSECLQAATSFDLGPQSILWAAYGPLER